MKTRKYNYTKIFFRRPLWTELNVLFLKFFSAVAVIVFSLTFLSIRYYDKYPDQVLKKKIKQNYIVEIVEFYEKSPVIMRFAVDDQKNSEADMFKSPADLAHQEARKEMEQVVKEMLDESIASAEVPQDMANDFQAQERSELNQSLVSFLKASSETKVSVRNAINDIASPITPSPRRFSSPIRRYDQQREKYQSNIKAFNESQSESVKMPEVEFTEFDVIEGYRDYEETISIANQNKKFVKLCIKKFYRNNPTVKGNIVVKFDIHPEGHVIDESIKIINSDIKDIRVLKCIERNIARWQNFPSIAYEMGKYSITQKYIF